MGFKRHLSSGEIIAQVMYYARMLKAENQSVTNIVLMGMGEPFHNYDNTMAAIDRLNDADGYNFGARRFTISPSAVSQHLKVLREARLVRVRAAGQQRVYEFDADGLAEIEEWLDGIGPAWYKRLEVIERQRRLEAASPSMSR